MHMVLTCNEYIAVVFTRAGQNRLLLSKVAGRNADILRRQKHAPEVGDFS